MIINNGLNHISKTNFGNNAERQTGVSESVPVNKPVNTDNPHRLITKQDDVWKLYEGNVLEKFIHSNPQYEQLLDKTLTLFREYGIPPSIEFLLKARERDSDVQLFLDAVKKNTGADLTVPPKVYRFVGKGEVEALKRGEILHPQRTNGKFDVTLNPDFNWNEYRITYKPKDAFSVLDRNSLMRKNSGSGKEYYYHLDSTYSMDDVEAIDVVKK